MKAETLLKYSDARGSDTGFCLHGLRTVRARRKAFFASGLEARRGGLVAWDMPILCRGVRGLWKRGVRL